MIVEKETILTGWNQIEVHTGFGKDYLRALAVKGDFPARKEGKRWVTTKEACDLWAAQRAKQARG